MPGPVVVQNLVCLVVLFFLSCQQIAFQSLQFEGQYGKVYDLSNEALISSHTLYFLKLLYQEWSGLQNINMFT